MLGDPHVQEQTSRRTRVLVVLLLCTKPLWLVQWSPLARQGMALGVHDASAGH